MSYLPIILEIQISITTVNADAVNIIARIKNTGLFSLKQIAEEYNIKVIRNISSIEKKIKDDEQQANDLYAYLNDKEATENYFTIQGFLVLLLFIVVLLTLLGLLRNFLNNCIVYKNNYFISCLYSETRDPELLKYMMRQEKYYNYAEKMLSRVFIIK